MEQATLTKKAPKAEPTGSVKIELPELKIKTIKLTLVGDSPLIVHKWAEKAIKEMLDKQMKKASAAKKAKDPEKEYKDSLYLYPGGGFGFPATAFKGAAVNACSHLQGVTKVEARGSFHVMGENKTGDQLVKINGTPTKHQAMVKIGMGTADIRFRGEFKEWSCVLEIRYNENMLTIEQIANLFNTAGFAIGVGEHRPQRNGQNGMFHVKRSGE